MRKARHSSFGGKADFRRLKLYAFIQGRDRLLICQKSGVWQIKNFHKFSDV